MNANRCLIRRTMLTNFLASHRRASLMFSPTLFRTTLTSPAQSMKSNLKIVVSLRTWPSETCRRLLQTTSSLAHTEVGGAFLDCSSSSAVRCIAFHTSVSDLPENRKTPQTAARRHNLPTKRLFLWNAYVLSHVSYINVRTNTYKRQKYKIHTAKMHKSVIRRKTPRCHRPPQVVAKRLAAVWVLIRLLQWTQHAFNG